MEERELPVGWIVAPIAELATKVGSGATPKGGQSAYLASGIPLIRSMNVVFFGFKKDGLAFISEGQAQQLSNAEVRRGDVLLNITGASIGRVTTAPDWSEGSRVNQHVCIIRPSECLYQTYLSAYLSSPAIQTFILDENYGVTRQALTKQQVLELEIPVPPLNEQRRVAAKLDTTLAAVDACRQRLDGVAAILKRFRQAVLAAATSGELTREWREERGGEESIKPVRLGEVIREMRNGLSPKPSLTPPGVRILRIGAIRPGSIDFEDCRYLELSPKDAEQYALLDGDLIFTRYNGTLEFVGVCALVQNVPGGYVYPDKLIRVRCDNGLALPAFVELAFGSANARAQIELLIKSSAGQKGVSGGDLKGIRFGLPSIPEQEEIVRRAQQLLTLAEQLEARLTAARKLVDRLTPALLAKAFRGELVPQDPGDEPASALLERIRAARQAEAAASGPSRRGRKKAAANPATVALEAAPAPADCLAALLRECGALSERALLAASELEPARFRAQLALEQGRGAILVTTEDDGQEVLEASA